MSLFRIAVLISGSGSTLQNLIHWKSINQLSVDFRLVISSKPDAAGIQYAREASIPVEIVAKDDFADATAYSEKVFSLCREQQVQLAVMGGFLEYLPIPEDFHNRVINIHPSLVPAFCGKGFYGDRVHQAALDYGVKVSGCTVHFVDDQYDHGPIIAQKACQVFEPDTAESLKRRVAELECQLYPEVIAAIARNQVCVADRKVTVRAIL